VEQDNPRLDKVVAGATVPLCVNSGTSSSLRLISKGMYVNNRGRKRNSFVFPIDKTKDDIMQDHQSSKKLLLLLLENEIYLCTVWCNPLNEINPTLGTPQITRTIENTITSDVNHDDGRHSSITNLILTIERLEGGDSIRLDEESAYGCPAL
jgi:hypothetical protein